MIASAICLFWLGGSQTPAQSGLGTAAVSAARSILRQQTQDGAITMGLPERGESTVIPYFGCFAADGLLAVYATNHDPVILHAVRNWIDWYSAHQNPDGTIYDYNGGNGNWRSTNHFDSSDSYAAVYLELLAKVYRIDPSKAWLARRAASIRLALAGIRLTMQPSGLTLAKPTYPVMYAMDNIETLRGLRAAHALATGLGDNPMSERTQSEADKMERGIASGLWDQAHECYRIGIQPDGGKMEGLKAWYPDIMANLMAVAWLPSSTRNRDLFGRMVARFGGDIPLSIHSVDDLEKLIWWSYAAHGAGDDRLFRQLVAHLAGFESLYANGGDCGNLGHVARLASE